MQLNKLGTISTRKHSYFYCYVSFIVFTRYPYCMFSFKQKNSLNQSHVLYPPKNIRGFYDFLMLLKGNVLKGNIGA